MIIRKIIALTLLILIAQINICLGASGEPIHVSLINIIASPDDFHGKIVRVTGVSVIEFEGNSLYLSREDVLNGVTKNAVWLAPNYNALKITEENLAENNGQYALIEGTFNKNNHGHMSLCSGAIENITRFQPWPPKDIKEKLTKRYSGSRKQPGSR
jgi:hypothetical protein